MKFLALHISQKKQCLVLFGLCITTFLFLLIESLFTVGSDDKLCDSFKNLNWAPILKHQSIFDSKLNPVFANNGNFCLPERPSIPMADWVVIEPHIFVYSAFLDDQGAPPPINTRHYVKLLATVLPSVALLRSTTPLGQIQLWCILKYLDNSTEIAAAYLDLLPEHHNMCYKAAYIVCPVPDHKKTPQEVTLTKDNTTNKWLEILSALTTLTKDAEMTEISICVRPLFGPYKSIIQLAEFISYYQSMGVSDINLYNYSISSEVSNFLEYLSQTNNASVKIRIWPWSLPYIDGELVHAEGQVIFIQDCLLRNRRTSRYVMMLDLDEFVMPQKSLNLSSTLAELERANPLAGSFLIPMVMFCEEHLPQIWDSDSLPLVTQIAKKRQETPWIHTYRSKFIARPSRINIGGIHEVWQNIEPFFMFHVPATVIMLYHYRCCCRMVQPWMLGIDFSPLHSDNFVNDFRMQSIKANVMNSSTISLIRKAIKRESLSQC